MIGVTGEDIFSAPELNSEKPYSEKVDVWSAGIVLYQLVTRGKKMKLRCQNGLETDEEYF